jgi:phosphate-selective porin OprO/OprP
MTHLLAVVLVALFFVSETQASVKSETDQETTTDVCARQSGGENIKDEAGQRTSSDHPKTCEGQNDEISRESRQAIASMIADDSQDAVTLKRLLLGRNYVFFGRLEVDGAIYTGDIPSSENGVDLRRLRVGVAGISPVHERLSYKAEVDLTDGTNNLSDLYLQFDLKNAGSFKLGNQRVSQNLSAMTGSLSQLFMEQPLPVTTFSLARRLAVSHDVSRRHYTAHGMFFTRDPNNDAGKYGWAVRLIGNPIKRIGKLGHVGVSFVSEKMDREARYRSRPESAVTDLRLVDTDLYYDVKYQHTAGLELAGGIKSYSARFELFHSRWDREGSESNKFNGAYFEIGHFLTGQDFNYKKGKFVRPELAHGERAWETGIRISWVDLNSRDVLGGEQVNVGVALNYYRRSNLRFMLNLLRYRTDAIAGDDRGWILQTRVQYHR